MATMNRPAFQAIRQHSPAKPALVFVSSRRQTRLTALDLIAYLAAEDDPKQWLHMSEQEMEQIIAGVKDSNLKLTLAFGIGMHHAGLQERDRKTVEELFVHQKIQVCTQHSLHSLMQEWCTYDMKQIFLACKHNLCGARCEWQNRSNTNTGTGAGVYRKGSKW